MKVINTKSTSTHFYGQLEQGDVFRVPRDLAELYMKTSGGDVNLRDGYMADCEKPGAEVLRVDAELVVKG